MRREQSEAGLSGAEQRDAARRSAPRAVVVFEAIRHEAEDELKRRNAALFWSGLAAGLSMGFSLIAEALLQAALPDAPWRPLISKLGYSVGFLIVILGRQQLFTENTLTPVIHVLRVGRLEVLWNMLRLWSVVLGANFLGTLIFGVGIYHVDLFDPGQTAALAAVALHATGPEFSEVFVGALFAGWLIALMVWLLPAAETARVGVIIIITYLIGVAGFPHIIAGSTQVFYSLAADAISLRAAVVDFFVPVLSGNIIGGVALVAALNYAQVSPDE
ncbi:MAG: formate/nitrite transporter family protein [Gammaproteobacteria bacterium]|jgi:formate/nitrite transporter FocA (FNT family)